MYKQIVSIMFTTMISFNYWSQGCTSRSSNLCFPLWFHLTIAHKDVQADCLNYVYHHDFLYLLFARMYKQIFPIMFTTMISFNNCLQGCTSILFQLCLQLWFHLTIVYWDVQQIVSIMFTTMISLPIVHKDVQADCLNYVYHYDFLIYCSQGCTSRLSKLCLPLWFHLTIVHRDVQPGCRNYIYH